MASSRRTFIRDTALAGAGLSLLNRPFPLHTPNPLIKKPGFSLLVLATNWGFNGSMEDFCARVKADGYDGFEVWVPDTEKGRSDLMNAAAKHGLSFGLLCGGSQPEPDKHLAHFEKALADACTMKPLYVNCHSGRDYFSFEDNRKFVEAGLQRSKSSGVPVYHETHRGRIMFATTVTKRFMDAYPDLKLTLDISHWCNVHESLLEDQEAVVTQALERTEHIHTRVGHAEGPQVNDPRAPEWAEAVNRHLGWWDKVVARKAAAGQRLTMLTEFGPPNYLPALPYTRQPVADQWAINVHMKNLLRERYR